jgi:hypothetical protein
MRCKQINDGPGLFGGGDEPGLFGAMVAKPPREAEPVATPVAEVAAPRATSDAPEPTAPAYDPKKLAVMLRCVNVMPSKLRAMVELGGIVCDWHTPVRGRITIVAAEVEVVQRHGQGKTAFTAELVDCRRPVTPAEAKAWGWSPIPAYMKHTCLWVLKDIKAVERSMSVPASFAVYVIKAGPSGWEIVNTIAAEAVN